jgi:uncharacterized repeat protein (TIGR02543 family)
LKRRTKGAAALTAAILSLLLAGSALAAPIDGRAGNAEDLRDELTVMGGFSSKTIILEADINYSEPIFLVFNNCTFDLNHHILNVVNAPLQAIFCTLSIIGEGELNIVGNYPVGVWALLSNVTVTNISSSGVGVDSTFSGVTVNGEISAPSYVMVEGCVKGKDDGVIGTGPDAGYLLYTEGQSFVRVKSSALQQQETYTVSYHPNWSLCEMPVDMNRYYRGDKVTPAIGEGLSNPGYKFAGWEFADGTPVTEPFIMGESDVTLFARWVKN